MSQNLTIASGKTLIISAGKKLIINKITLTYVSPYNGTLTNNGTISIEGTSTDPAKFKITDNLTIGGAFSGINGQKAHQTIEISSGKTLTYKGSVNLQNSSLITISGNLASSPTTNLITAADTALSAGPNAANDSTKLNYIKNNLDPGASLNAFTGREKKALAVRHRKKMIKKLIEKLSDKKSATIEASLIYNDDERDYSTLKADELARFNIFKSKKLKIRESKQITGWPSPTLKQIQATAHGNALNYQLRMKAELDEEGDSFAVRLPGGTVVIFYVNSVNDVTNEIEYAMQKGNDPVIIFKSQLIDEIKEVSVKEGNTSYYFYLGGLLVGQSSEISRTLRKIILSSSDRTYRLRNRTVFSGKSNNACVRVSAVSGPGDDTHSRDPIFLGGLLRLKQSGKKGTDKKHGSYERYLAKKVYNEQCNNFVN